MEDVERTSKNMFFDTLDNSLKREIFEYLVEKPESDLSEIYESVHQVYDRESEGPLNIESEVDDMPYVHQKLESESSSSDVLNEVYEVSPVAERAYKLAEIGLQGSIYHQNGDLVRGLEALLTMNSEELDEVWESGQVGKKRLEND